MKKEELTKLGLTDEQADAVFALAGKDIAKHQKTIETLTAERDDYKTRLGTAEETLKGFGGKTPEDVQKEIDKYKQDSAEASKRFEAQLTARDQKDWLNAQYDKLGVTSPYARAALTAEAQTEGSGLTWKDGAYMGFDDYMKRPRRRMVPSTRLQRRRQRLVKRSPPRPNRNRQLLVLPEQTLV